MKHIYTIIMIAVILTSSAIGQAKLTENTLRLKKEQTGAKAKVSDMDWLTGSWTATAFGGRVKEIWTNPGGGVMIGMFSLIKNDKPVFYEFLTFTIEKESLILKLKHFHPNLVTWEEKEKTTDFRFIKQEGNRYYFHGLTFENVSKNKLNIYLALSQNGKTREEIFNFSRADL